MQAEASSPTQHRQDVTASNHVIHLVFDIGKARQRKWPSFICVKKRAVTFLGNMKTHCYSLIVRLLACQQEPTERMQAR